MQLPALITLVLRICNLYLRLKESNANTTFICFVENAPKYKGIVHQRDVWHGAKNVTKKVIDVSIFNIIIEVHLFGFIVVN